MVEKENLEMEAAAAEFTGTDEENAAAAKIQAGFKGKKVRDEMKAKKAEGEPAAGGDGDAAAAAEPAAEPTAEPAAEPAAEEAAAAPAETEPAE